MSPVTSSSSPGPESPESGMVPESAVESSGVEVSGETFEFKFEPWEPSGKSWFGASSGRASSMGVTSSSSGGTGDRALLVRF